MSNLEKPNGCSKLLRRTFLFLVALFITRQLNSFFSVAENRSNFLNFIIQNTQKLINWLTQLNTGPSPQPVTPSSPVKPQNSPATLPKAPVAKVSKPASLPSNPSPKIVTPQRKGKPVQVRREFAAGVPFYQTTIDLTDADTLITLGLANNAKFANSSKVSNGDEPFEKMVKRYPAAVIANGTFFGKDQRKWVLGNMVAAGKFLKYSRWENYGTTLGIREGNRPEMITARAEGKPEWNQHWFSLTCGPRLLKQGKVWLAPKLEGFTDPHVLNQGYRTAIGFPQNGKELYLISFLASLSLQKEAEVMKAIGCYEAMNLDGGASEALAHKGQILIPPGRNFTNVIIVYDVNDPAPSSLKTAWQAFQKGARPSYENWESQK